MSNDVDHDLPPNIIPISKLDSISPADHLYAHMAKAHVEDVDLSEKWLINSGASQIMCSNHHWFHQYTPLSPLIMITLGDNCRRSGGQPGPPEQDHTARTVGACCTSTPTRCLVCIHSTYPI
jgi:hypothetical protein